MASQRQVRTGLAAALRSASVAVAVAALAACGGGGGGGTDTTAAGGTAPGPGTQPAAPSGAPVAIGTPPATIGGGTSPSGPAAAPGTSDTGTATGSPATGSTGSTGGTGSSGSGSASAGTMASVVFQRSDFQVNTLTAGSQSGANIARLANGSYVAVWDSTAAAFGPTEVHMQRLDPQGLALGAEQVVSAHGSASRVTPFADGRFLVTWRVSPYALEVDGQGQLFDPQGIALGSTIALGSSVNGFTPFPMALPDGSFIAASDISGGGKFGPSYGQIARFAAEGTPLGPVTRLESQLTVQTGAFSPNAAGQVSTALLADGRIAAVWVASGTDVSELRLSLFDAQAQPLGGYAVLDTRAVPILSPAIAVLADGRRAVAWVAGAGDQPQTAFLEFFDASGASLGRQQLAATQGGTFQLIVPKLAALADGSLAVAWAQTTWDGAQSHRELFTQRFDRAGTPQGAAQQVDATAAWAADDLPADSLGLAGTTGSGFILLSGRWTPQESWDVRATTH